MTPVSRNVLNSGGVLGVLSENTSQGCWFASKVGVQFCAAEAWARCGMLLLEASHPISEGGGHLEKIVPEGQVPVGEHSP